MHVQVFKTTIQTHNLYNDSALFSKSIHCFDRMALRALVSRVVIAAIQLHNSERVSAERTNAAGFLHIHVTQTEKIPAQYYPDTEVPLQLGYRFQQVLNSDQNNPAFCSYFKSQC